MSSLKEADIVRAILRYLKTVPNCFCWKEHGGMYGTAGIPDVIACIGVLRKIQKCGGNAAIVRSVEEVKRMLEEITA